MKSAVAAILASVVMVPLFVLVSLGPTFFVMLGLGAAHDQWPAIPPLGFWSTFLILNALALVAAAVRGSKTEIEEDGRRR